MTKHTPGPWSVPHFAKPDVNCQCEYVLSEEGFGAVASVHCSGDGEDIFAHGDNPKFEQAVANARLIAAAPDLLDALENLCIGIGMGWDLEGMVEVAQKAIAKATGSVVAEKATGGGGE